MRKRQLLWLTYAAVVGMVLAAPPLTRAQARPWDLAVSGFAGGAIPCTLDVSLTDPATATDLRGEGVALQTSVSFGGKVGAWWTGLRSNLRLDFGVEVEVTQFFPDIQQQDIRIRGTVGGTPAVGTLTLDQMDISATIVAANLMARWPLGVTAALPHGRVSPYVGVGGGVEIAGAKLRDSPSETDTAGVFQALAGLQVFLTQRVALFAEYKYTLAEHTFTRDTVQLSVNHLVGGVAVHF